MRILVIGSDRKMFDESSAVAQRQIDYAGISNNLDIVVFSASSLQLKTTKLSENVVVYPSNSFSRWLYIFDAFRVSRKLSKPDLVSVQDPFESGLAGYVMGKYFGVPLQVQIHTDLMSSFFFRDSLLNKIRFYIAKFIIPCAKSIRVVSQRIKKSLLAVYPKISESIIQVLPVYMDFEKIRSAQIDVDLHKKYPQFKSIILMASRLTKEKNIDLAVDAMVEVVKKFPNTGLIIVGNGSERERLGWRVEGLGLQKNVIFEGWNNDLASYYKTAELFLLTSNYDGYAMTIVESLTAGTPVVMSNVGCAGEVVVDGQNGLIFPVGDLDRLVGCITKMLSDPELRNGIKLGAQKMVWQTNKDEYLRLYRRSWETTLG
ncbi:MAG: glycosyltransferase family 4 protein [Candidatus Vogelbacteria bacterium]|nr:glycosyltransferase family 4 protein [Candidatus Vogelbacteria bacterium]